MVESIESKLKVREPRKYLPPRRVATILRENSGKITSRVLAKMKAHSELRLLRLSDGERTDHVPKMLQTIVGALQANGNQFDDDFLGAATQHGRLRLKQGYALPLMVEVRLVDESIYETVQENLLSVDVSHLILDLRGPWDFGKTTERISQGILKSGIQLQDSCTVLGRTDLPRKIDVWRGMNPGLKDTVVRGPAKQHLPGEEAPLLLSSAAALLAAI